MEARNNNDNDNALWVFGYGSLCWHPGFEYRKSALGYVKGFSRKFWQGNTTHRGTPEKPGRVATLVEERESIVYGRAFQVQDSTALPYLERREGTLGGYTTTISTFYSREGVRNFPVIIYIATNKSEHWLGDAPLHSIAMQIAESSGPSGHNVEYLLRLAEFMHRYLPEAHDEHLFTLELLVRSRIKEENMCLNTLMGNREFHIDLEDTGIDVRDEENNLAGNNAGNNLRENSFQYILQVPDTTLRCLKK
ncbi:putative glutathione-specific gamma-glutamylcyclotransferase 2 [Ceratina calcarata]|uniref:glutathione-specific gamma-glutamylcyclotransferase n=1 Tax=Ceratina calcarata TaxID=156304 RepID=A0AAJ7RZE9_9HYME|nr:putative glutathione-specific gamma-glutamylcyclotransferase 2 [Ceratina calcarata]